MATAEPSPDSSNSQPSYPQAIFRVAVAQMCLNAGYGGAEASALRALTDIAGRYIGLLASNAASAANSRGRTQSNILDLAVALECAAAGRGFAGASDITRPLLRSSVLRELRAFVAAVDEIPFPRPIPRQKATDAVRKQTPSFAQAGRVPPLTHVPRWLPCFPEGWRSGRGGSIKVDEKIEPQKGSPAISSSPGVTGMEYMMRERARVRFSLALGGEQNGGKRKKVEIGNCFALRKEEEEEEEEKISSFRNCRRRRDSNRDKFYKKYPEKPASPIGEIVM